VSTSDCHLLFKLCRYSDRIPETPFRETPVHARVFALKEAPPDAGQLSPTPATAAAACALWAESVIIGLSYSRQYEISPSVNSKTAM